MLSVFFKDIIILMIMILARPLLNCIYARHIIYNILNTSNAQIKPPGDSGGAFLSPRPPPLPLLYSGTATTSHSDVIKSTSMGFFTGLK